MPKYKEKHFTVFHWFHYILYNWNSNLNKTKRIKSKTQKKTFILPWSPFDEHRCLELKDSSPSPVKTNSKINLIKKNSIKKVHWKINFVEKKTPRWQSTPLNKQLHKKKLHWKIYFVEKKLHWKKKYCTYRQNWTRKKFVGHIWNSQSLKPKRFTQSGCKDNKESKGKCSISFWLWSHKKNVSSHLKGL